MVTSWTYAFMAVLFWEGLHHRTCTVNCKLKVWLLCKSLPKEKGHRITWKLIPKPISDCRKKEKFIPVVTFRPTGGHQCQQLTTLGAGLCIVTIGALWKVLGKWKKKKGSSDLMGQISLKFWTWKPPRFVQSSFWIFLLDLMCHRWFKQFLTTQHFWFTPSNLENTWIDFAAMARRSLLQALRWLLRFRLAQSLRRQDYKEFSVLQHRNARPPQTFWGDVLSDKKPSISWFQIPGKKNRPACRAGAFDQCGHLKKLNVSWKAHFSQKLQEMVHVYAVESPHSPKWSSIKFGSIYL